MNLQSLLHLNEFETPLKHGVGALVVRRDGRVLSASRRGDPSNIGLVGGKVEPGEPEIEAVLRELLEEAKIRARKVVRIFGSPDGHGYWFVTYLVIEWDWEDPQYEKLDSYEVEKGIAIRWSEVDDFLKTECAFRDYNLDLFYAVGLVTQLSV